MFHVNNAAYIKPGNVDLIDRRDCDLVLFVDAANGTITAILPVRRRNGRGRNTVVISSLTVTVSAGMNLATLTSPSPLDAGESSDWESRRKYQRRRHRTAGAQLGQLHRILSKAAQRRYSRLQPQLRYLRRCWYWYLHVQLRQRSYRQRPTWHSGYVVQSASGNFPPGWNACKRRGDRHDDCRRRFLDLSAIYEADSQHSGWRRCISVDRPPRFWLHSSGHTVDGTIKLAVVNQSGMIGVQEKFDDTASQTSVTASICSSRANARCPSTASSRRSAILALPTSVRPHISKCCSRWPRLPRRRRSPRNPDPTKAM